MRELDPMQTNRAESWQLYHNAPMPMVTIFKTIDISNLLQLKANGYKLNMLLCYCILQAAAQVPAFRLLPTEKAMAEYGHVGINVIVANQKGGLSTCDIPYCATLEAFSRAYLELTEAAARTCCNHEIDDHMIVGTSSLVRYDIDGVVNMYSGIFNNPFLIWGKYRVQQGRALLQLSFQFHHVQMDGMEACEFLELVQRQADSLSP